MAQYISAMGGRRSDGSDIRRFLTWLIAASLFFGAVGVVWGEQIADALEKTPTTATGWLLIGWLVSGPPLLVALLAWHDRGRMRLQRRRDVGVYLALWLGLSMLLLPTVLHGPEKYFGQDSTAADPLTTGWVWGAGANVVGVLFAAAVLGALRSSVRGRPSARQVGLTYRFLEVGWTVVLLVSLGLCLYGNANGLFGL